MSKTNKKHIAKSVELMKSGLSFEDNVKQIKCTNSDDKLYIKACIAYNYQLYDKSLEYLIHLYNEYDKIEHTLFSYASYGFLVNNFNVDELFLSHICKIHFEIKDLYDKSHLELLNKSVYHYVTNSRQVPVCVIQFLSSVIDSEIVKKIYKSTDPAEKVANTFLSASVNFEKLTGKNIVHCYYNESSSGMGDFLRGSCYLFDLLEGKNLDFHLNFTKHDISKYLRSPSKFSFKKKEILDTEKINKDSCVGKNYIQNIKDNLIDVLENTKGSNIYMFTNYSDFIDNKAKAERISLTKSCQEFMKKNLIFTHDVTSESDKIIKSLGMEYYSIMHFRLGDRMCLKGVQKEELSEENLNTKEYDINLDDLKNIIIEKQKITGNHIIVMSDSNELKEHIKEHCDNNFIHVVHSNSQHCSNNPGNISKLKINKKEKVHNMFYVALDMNLISRSSSIYSYSVYPWGSGFVFWLAKIFNIPILTTQIGV